MDSASPAQFRQADPPVLVAVAFFMEALDTTKSSTPPFPQSHGRSM